MIYTFFMSVGASIVAGFILHYIRKWLDGLHDGDD